MGVFREVWAHRDLAVVLAWRELVVRYKRSVLGVGWALVEPAAMAFVYVAVFGYVLNAGAGLSNFSLFILAGVLAWGYISSTLEQAAGTLLQYDVVIKKVYFPRELLLFAVVFSRLTTLVAGFVVLALAAAVFADPGTIAFDRMWLVLLGTVATTGILFGLGLVLAALQVILRDVTFLLRFALRLLFYACPIVYPISRVPPWARDVYDLNPLVGLLWTFQACMDQAVPAPSTAAFTSTILFALIVPIGGWALFRRIQWGVVDAL